MVANHIKRHTVSYRYALKGLKYALVSQPNFWIHLFWAALAVTLGFYFAIDPFEWLVLVLTISSVLIAEMLNTALEIVTDALKEHKRTPQDDFYIMVAKDVGAGAVLLAATASVIIGLIIFVPRFQILFV